MNFLSVLYAKAGIIVDGVTTLNNTATALTPATNDNSTNIATTGYVKNQNYYPYPTGTTSQYVRGDGSLATFTQTGGGGSSVSYYLNGSVSQGTIGGNAYYEMSKNAIIGTNADFNLNADGYIAQFVTDAGDPALLNIPGGNWNFEMFFSASSGGGSPSFYVELYKYDGTTLTLIASGSAIPESITGGTSTDLYVTALAVPTTTLTLTDRLAVRVYVTHSGRTITLHTQNGHLCQVITTFTTGLTALNGLTAQVQNFAVGTSGSDFAISSVTDTHTFNLPTASATKRGALSSIDWSAFDAKVDFGDLSATSPLNYNGSGVFSIAQSSTSTNGYVSSTDWNTFNNKQNALTNPVTGTGTTNYITKWVSGSAVGNSIIYDNGTNVGIGTTTPGYKLQVVGEIYNNYRVQINDGTAVLLIGHWDGVNARIENSGGRDLFITSYSSAIKFGISGSENMRIATNGNVGIGTASPASLLNLASTFPQLTLTRTDNASSPAAAINFTSTSTVRWQIATNNAVGTGFEINQADGSTNRFYINTSGNVGIGTASPSQKLDVAGQASIGSGAQAIVGTDGTYAGYSTIGFGGTTNGYNRVFGNSGTGDGLYIAAATSNAIVFWTNGANERMIITAAGNIGIGTNNPLAKLQVSAGRSYFFSGDNYSVALAQTAAQGNYMYLGTAADGTFYISETSGTARVTVQQGGNVGIGTTSPGTTLDVAGIFRVTGSASTLGTFESSNSSVFIGLKDSSGDFVYLGNDDGDFLVQTPTSGYSTKLIVKDNGNVGIGTTTDAGYKLDVNGTARVSGYFNVNAQADAANGSINVESIDPTLRFRVTGGTANKRIYEWRAIAAGGAYDYLQLRLWNDAQSSATELMGIASTGAATFSSSVTAASLIKSGGTSSQYLMADGSISTLTNPITGTGTTNYLPKFTGASALGDSLISDNGTLINVAAQFKVAGGDSFFGTGSLTRILGASQVIDFTNAAQDTYVAGRINGLSLKFYGNNGTGIDITSAGSIGIGTTSPNTKLHTTGSLTVDDIIYLQRASSSLFLPIANYWNGSGSPLAGTKGDILAIGNAAGDGLVFVNSNTETMRIAPSGNVLIGTTTDAGYKLDVNGTARVSGRLAIGSTTNYSALQNANNSGNIYWGIDNSSGSDFTGVAYARFIYSEGAYPLITYVNGSERMRITSGGNLLIGTTTDAGYKLDVNGTARVVGELTVGGDLKYSSNIGYGIISQNGARLVAIQNSLFSVFGSAIISSNITANSLIKSGGTSSQYLMADGSTSTLTNPITGTGTTNYLPKFTGASALGNSIIYDSGTNVGIGTATPSRKLSLLGGTDGGVYVLANAGATSLPTDGLSLTTGYNVSYLSSRSLGVVGGIADLSYSAKDHNFDNGTDVKMVIKSGGNVLIGTTTDAGYKLDVNGTLRGNNSLILINGAGDAYSTKISTAFDSGGQIIQSFIDSNAGTAWQGRLFFRTSSNGGALTTQLTIEHSGAATFSSSVTATSFGGNAYPYNSILGSGADASTGTVFAGSTSGYASSMDIAGGGATNPNTIIFKTASIERVRIASNGNVGINTNDPLARLDIASAYNSSNKLLYVRNSSGTINTNAYDTVVFQQDDVTTLRIVERNISGTDQLMTLSIGDGYGRIAVSDQPLQFFVNGSPTGVGYQGLGGTMAMHIAINANVGIGTSSPANKLVVTSDATYNNENSYAIASAAASNPAYKTIIGYDYANDIGVIAAVRTGIQWKNISIPQGNLLIGTTTDAGYKLNVNGTSIFSGNIRIENAAGGTALLQLVNNETSPNNNNWSLLAGFGGARQFQIRDNLGGERFSINGSGAATFASSVTATNFIVPGGTSAQFLKADGSLDSNVYLTATSSTFSYTASVTLSPTWQNTGVSSANLGTGAYLVTCNADDYSVGGGQYNCTYTGLMYFFAGATNGSNANEIVLHHTGHADNGRYIYLRTLNTVSADGKTYLQISGNGTNSGASNYQLTFKKLL